MNQRILVLGIVTIALGVALALMVRSMLSGTQPEQTVQKVESKPTVEVMVAAQNMPIGTIITPEHLTWQSWPDERDVHRAVLTCRNNADGRTHGVPTDVSRLDFKAYSARSVGIPQRELPDLSLERPCASVYPRQRAT